MVLVEEGHEEFKTNLQRQPDALKESSSESMSSLITMFVSVLI